MFENDFAEKRHDYAKNLVLWSVIYHNEANGDQPKTQQEEIIHEKDPENERSGTQPAGKWYTDFGSYEAEKKSAGELTERIMEEGVVLLKNDGILPLAKSIKNVTLFGARSFDPVTGGTGSGGGGGVIPPCRTAWKRPGSKSMTK